MEDFDGGTGTAPSDSIPDASAPAPATAAPEAPAPKKRTRTSVRALRREIKTLRDQNEALTGSVATVREQRDAKSRRIYELEDQVFELEREKDALTQQLTDARSALELVLAILVIRIGDSVAGLMGKLNKYATDFGFSFRSIKDELLAGLGKAYAKAPERIDAELQEKRAEGVGGALAAILGGNPGRPGIHAVSGSGIGPLLAALGALGTGPDRGPDPTRGIVDIGLPEDLLAELFANDPAQDEYDPRNTPEAYFHPGKAHCQGHPRRR